MWPKTGAKETAFLLLSVLNLYASTKSRKQVDSFHEMGLCSSCNRVLEGTEEGIEELNIG